MSFLVSFNGQFTPHVYQVGASSYGVSAPRPLKEVQTKPDTGEFSHIMEDSLHAKAELKGHAAYQSQQKIFEEKKQRLYAHDLMSSPLHTIQQTEKVARAREVLQKMGFRHLPVIDQDQNLRGLLCDRDLIGMKESLSVEKIMQKQVIVGQEKTRIQDIAHLMLEERLNALPIIDHRHKLVGIITLSDILKFVVHLDEFRERA